MLNFILYEDDENMRILYKKIIRRLLGNKNNHYKIIEFDSYNVATKDELKNTVDNKIYILDIEVPGKSGLDLAREIRKNGDWQSQIIILTSHEKFDKVGYTNKLLMLDFIHKTSNVENSLSEAILVALDIITSQESLCFIIDKEMYQIPYNQILYIEKELNNNNCVIVTENNKYMIRETIQHLEKELCKNYRFMKTHRSCIVNLNKITSVDLSNNTISFTNKKISLISRNNKKALKERLQKELV